MPNLITISHLFFLIFILILGIYSWFYKIGVQKTKESLGIKLPQIVEKILTLNLFLSIFAMFLGFIFLIVFSGKV